MLLQTRHAMLIVVPAILAGSAACGTEEAGDDSHGVAEAAMIGLMTEPSIIGTFRDEHIPAGIAVLTLKTDSTYHTEEAVQCVRYPCDRPSENGSYRYTRVEGINVLVLMPEREGQIHQLKYKLKGDTLYIAPFVRESGWQALRRSDISWCEAPTDCALQSLPVGPCAGEWVCPANTCFYTCGVIACDQSNASNGCSPAYSSIQ